ncbi:Fer4_NifH domain containing protein [uncultured Caudovirales phage]|uniref:Fer4_NifH domain containing protein n=1 Tax=uncultured Caudovirales phage TaxID=2100421 RepID=A0A6J5MYB8_9CAUD|nr:Fer4_NifH domain containing protein [uncultured Caudovirales phage]
MSLLKPATNQTAYLKAGILGFQGSGKTFTATRLASGLAHQTKKKRPKVAFFDTEKGSDFFVKYFESENIQFDVAKSRTFIDLIAFMREVEDGGYDVVIIDSISHVWNDLRNSYEKRLRRSNGLLFQDWGKVKGEWQQFTDLFINGKTHTIVLGRAGYEYDMSEDESGKKELLKTGTKMKAEGEFGYESDLLLEMERVKNQNKKGWSNRCYVLKDRTDTMNGKVIDMPKYSDFKSVVATLNIGGEHFGIDGTKDSQAMFGNPDYSYAERRKQRDIALDELQEILIELDLQGTSGAVIKKRTELLKDIYGTSSKTAIEDMTAEQIRNGITVIKERLVANTAKEVMEGMEDEEPNLDELPG